MSSVLKTIQIKQAGKPLLNAKKAAVDPLISKSKKEIKKALLEAGRMFSDVSAVKDLSTIRANYNMATGVQSDVSVLGIYDELKRGKKEFYIGGLNFKVEDVSMQEARRIYAMHTVYTVASGYNEAIDDASKTYKKMTGNDYAKPSLPIGIKTFTGDGLNLVNYLVKEKLPKLEAASKKENYRKNSLTSKDIKSLLVEDHKLQDFGGNRMMMFYHNILNALHQLDDDKYYNAFLAIISSSKNLDSLYKKVLKPRFSYFISDLLFKYKGEITDKFSDYAELDELINDMFASTIDKKRTDPKLGDAFYDWLSEQDSDFLFDKNKIKAESKKRLEG